jgi:hypothetical protein
MMNLDDEVLPNIHSAYLHMVARRSPVFLRIELLKWIIDHIDTQKCLINDDNGECVRVFLPSEVQNYYNLKDSELKLSIDFILSFYASHDTSKIMSSWWREDKKFTNQTAGWYPMTKSQGTIHIPHGFALQVTWGKRLFPIFIVLDASGFYNLHFRCRLQLGCHHLQIVKHLHKTGSGAEGGRYPRLLHDLISI